MTDSIPQVLPSPKAAQFHIQVQTPRSVIFPQETGLSPNFPTSVPGPSPPCKLEFPAPFDSSPSSLSCLCLHLIQFTVKHLWTPLLLFPALWMPSLQQLPLRPLFLSLVPPFILPGTFKMPRRREWRDYGDGGGGRILWR